MKKKVNHRTNLFLKKKNILSKARTLNSKSLNIRCQLFYYFQNVHLSRSDTANKTLMMFHNRNIAERTLAAIMLVDG